MSTILDKILADKKTEVETLKELTTPDTFLSQIGFLKSRHSLRNSLLERKLGIIAEIKKSSPSKGVLREDFNVAEIAKAYTSAGAAGISILTDQLYFGGRPLDLATGRAQTSLPILRKDFFIDEIQLYQARALGADVILLIAAALQPNELKKLAKKARELELEVLLEVHSKEELDRSLNSDVTFVGVNNRDLKTFTVSLERCHELAEHIPAEFIKIAESGIKTFDDIKTLASWGYTGFLIGESFLTSSDPEAACRSFVEAIR